MEHSPVRPVNEQTILVTGATDGHGHGLAMELAAGGASVLVHGRDDHRGRQVVDEIRHRTDNKHVQWLRADLSSLAETRTLAEQVAREHERVDALVNNAGIGATTEGDVQRRESRDGYELRFAVNYLAGYLLTRLLIPLLEHSAPARIVNVASAGQAPIDFDNVMLERGYDGVRAYSQSKLAQNMPTKIVRADGITPTSSLDDGIQATLRVVTDPKLEGVTGRYYNGHTPAEPHPQAHDRDARQRLRELSDELCGCSG